MTNIQNFIDDLKRKAEKRYNDFKIDEIDTISKIKEDAYLEKPTWVGGDNKFVCLFVDLDKSSKISFKKHALTMAKIYDYFTQTLVDVFNHNSFCADYVDVKGDGAFAIYEGEHASYKAFYAAITFRKIFEEKIKTRFQDDKGENLSCKIGIHKDKILVKKVGKRGDYNEVWAGRLVNNAAKLSKEYEKAPEKFNSALSPIIISEEVYKDFEVHPEFGLHNCHDGDVDILSQEKPVFTEVTDFSDDTLGDKFYFTQVGWCVHCADNYIDQLN
jgi:class 3 adenylate cyclase